MKKIFEIEVSDYVGMTAGKVLNCLRGNQCYFVANKINVKELKNSRIESTRHDGDCSFYSYIINGNIWDGICTCGYGRDKMGDPEYDYSEMVSTEKVIQHQKDEISRLRCLVEDNKNTLETILDDGTIDTSSKMIGLAALSRINEEL